MRMCGTVKCRPTLAYRVHFDSIIISDCFQSPMVTQPFVSQHKAHMSEMVNYFLIDVAQVYRVHVTWELALNAAMGMKRISSA